VFLLIEASEDSRARILTMITASTTFQHIVGFLAAHRERIHRLRVLAEEQTGGRNMTAINSDLSMTPSDPAEALNYPALFALWQEAQTRWQSGNDFTEIEFAEWDSKVQALLRLTERLRFQKPLGPDVPLNKDTIQHARSKWLTRILWARQGAEKLMDPKPE
jgi:hypothetical protein